MKNQTKAVIASIVVIALALTAVSGITYSWFSDTEKANITVSTAAINYEVSYSAVNENKNNKTTIEDETGYVFKINNLAANAKIKVTAAITNKSTIDTKYKLFVTPTEVGNLTEYDLENVQVGQFNVNGNFSGKSLSEGVNVAAMNDWVELGVNSKSATCVFYIITPTTYGGDPENPEDIKYTDENGQEQIWNAQTARSGLTLEFKVIAVQGDYSTTTP